MFVTEKSAKKQTTIQIKLKKRRKNLSVISHLKNILGRRFWIGTCWLTWLFYLLNDWNQSCDDQNSNRKIQGTYWFLKLTFKFVFSPRIACVLLSTGLWSRPIWTIMIQKKIITCQFNVMTVLWSDWWTEKQL